MNGTGDDSFLLARFREFYREVIRLKQMVQGGTWHTAPPPETPAPAAAAAPGEGTQVAARVWQRLVSILETQALTAGRSTGAYGAELYREAQYVMAALADEVFLNTEWEGRETWRSNLVEARLFGSHKAGDELFQRLETLLSRRDPVWAEVAKVYLMALALGFRGRFRGLDDGGQLDAYRRQLFTFVFQRKPELQTSTRPLFEEAYAHTLTEGRGQRLPTARPWAFVLVAVIAMFLVSSHVVFKRVTDPLHDVTQAIIEQR
ncbi:MAG: DotU family type IV/VI secretion system protein [Candidatus Rokubacteria bacterium]|nr:DotU family type IV/VI secretion system protein [Candidatus Rokubacteria bacterium]